MLLSRIFNSCLGVAVALVLGSASAAEAIETFFGHSVTVTGGYPEVSLKIDGREVLKDAIIAIDEVHVVGGIPTLVGSNANGGSACPGSRFIISFPPGGLPKIDGPIDTCAEPKLVVSIDQLRFATTPIPGQDGEVWIWTPEDGLRSAAPIAFKVDDTKGWGDLRSRMLNHPSDVFANGAVARDLDALLGPDKSRFQSIISGVGGGEFKGDSYIGTACTPHMCGDEEALVFLDVPGHKAYVAWKPYEKKIIVRPPVKEWPPTARLELKNWAGKFQ